MTISANSATAAAATGDLRTLLSGALSIHSTNVRSKVHLKLLTIAWLLLTPVRHRGIMHVARAVAHVMPADNSVFVTLPGGNRISVPLRDLSWLPHVLTGKLHEPELLALFDKVMHPGVRFVDGGANIGYWSAIAASRLKPEGIVAVEPASSTYRWLEANSFVGFRTVRAALTSPETKEVLIEVSSDRSWNTSGKLRSPDPASVETVPGTTVDELCSRWSGDIILKLDVEGLEVESLKGAREILKQNCLLIYEDHGSDLDCSASRFVLDELRFNIYRPSPDGELVRVHSISEVAAVKQNRRHGYDFVAIRPNTRFPGCTIREDS